MKQITNDPVLHFTAGLVSVIKWLWWFGAAACALLGLFLTGGLAFDLHIDIPETFGALNADQTLIVFIIFMVIVAVLCFVLAKFFGALRTIIDSVESGSPLTYSNAEKLEYMAKLLCVALVLGLMADISGTYYFPDKPGEGIDYYEVISNFLTTLLPIGLLFILSHIFKRGAAMQEELEGTV
jgi:hypothetical protein